MRLNGLEPNGPHLILGLCGLGSRLEGLGLALGPWTTLTTLGIVEGATIRERTSKVDGEQEIVAGDEIGIGNLGYSDQ